LTYGNGSNIGSVEQWKVIKKDPILAQNLAQGEEVQTMTETMFKEQPNFGCIRLDSYGPGCIFSVNGLASMIGVEVDKVEQAIEVGELPEPFTLMGERAWMVEQIIDHLRKRGEEK
jgi:hypothetical protein